MPLAQGAEGVATNAGWYRIARSYGGGGNRAHGFFNIMTLCGCCYHESVGFYLGVSFAHPSYSASRHFSLVSRAELNAYGSPIGAARIVYPTNDLYGYAYAEIYVVQHPGNTVPIWWSLSENNWNMGWIPLAFGPGSIPAGYTADQFALDGVDFNLENKLLLTETGNFGIGVTNPVRRLQVAGSALVSDGLAAGNGIATTLCTVALGSNVVASGVGSFAAGKNATASHSQSFVWSDGASVSSTASNQFTVSASGGIRWLAGSIYMTPQGDISMGSFTNGAGQ
jgi:hypothetical protein